MAVAGRASSKLCLVAREVFVENGNFEGSRLILRLIVPVVEIKSRLVFVQIGEFRAKAGRGLKTCVIKNRLAKIRAK